MNILFKHLSFTFLVQVKCVRCAFKHACSLSQRTKQSQISISHAKDLRPYFGVDNLIDRDLSSYQSFNVIVMHTSVACKRYFGFFFLL